MTLWKYHIKLFLRYYQRRCHFNNNVNDNLSWCLEVKMKLQLFDVTYCNLLQMVDFDFRNNFPQWGVWFTMFCFYYYKWAIDKRGDFFGCRKKKIFIYEKRNFGSFVVFVVVCLTLNFPLPLLLHYWHFKKIENCIETFEYSSLAWLVR